jgi:DNA adenine methylase
MASPQRSEADGPPTSPAARPFLKWAGGKQQLLPSLLEAAPASFGRYFEPFVGGGALFFALAGRRPGLPATLGDANPDLVTAYEVVRDDLDTLTSRLAQIERDYLAEDAAGRADCYYRMRDSVPGDRAELAARFIFLNKTCYNGLYRVNSRGLFNVPHGRYREPRILDRDALDAASRALAGVDLACADFEQSCAAARAGDFVYFDPPFHPLSPTSNFTQYTSADFGWPDQQRLRACIDGLTERGVHVLLSDSPHPLVIYLYESAGYELRRVPARRAINSKPALRGPIDELLVSNAPLLARGKRPLSRPARRPPRRPASDGAAPRAPRATAPSPSMVVPRSGLPPR